ncbi:hypothetical protein RZS08_66145, partial [Arthrospira platensis SPKY1]|nr:hypothetical protein [Arthrospira platensis SPKY1]
MGFVALVVAAAWLGVPRLQGWPKGPAPAHRWSWDGELFGGAVGVDFFAIYEAGVFLRAGRDPYLVDGPTIAETGIELRAPYIATYRYLPMTTYWLAAP